MERQKATRDQARADAQRVRIADFILRDHAAQFARAERSTIENGFRFIMRMSRGAFLHGTGKKEITAFIGKSGRGKIMTERDEQAVGSEFEAGFLAQLA